MSGLVIPCLLSAALLCSPLPAMGQQHPTVAEVGDRWRKAIHAKGSATRDAVVVVETESTEDGITGHVRELIASDGSYRQEIRREFDEAEVAVSQGSAARRDWNGFVRNVEGEELKRLRTRMSELQTLVFGPSELAEDFCDLRGHSLAAPQQDEHGLYVVQSAVSGGFRVNWYIDPKTWLPVKSTRPGQDSTITTQYIAFSGQYGAHGNVVGGKSFGTGILTPIRARVSETDKPDYEWQRKQVSPYAAKTRDFMPPGPRVSDTRMGAAISPPIPFTFESNHIVIPVRVNGRPPIGFILDTGADQEVINLTRMGDLGLAAYAKSMTTGGGNSAEYSYSKDATFSLPGAELLKQHVAALDQTGIEQALGIPLGGLLGFDFISRFVVEIDYEKRVIVLHDPQRWAYAGSGTVIPLTFDEGIPFLHATISVPTKPNLPAYFVLDSGAAETMTLTSPFVKANDLARLAQTNPTVNRPAGLETQFFAQNNVRGRIAELNLHGLVIRDIPINMSVNTKGAYASESFSGTVGESVLRRYHVFLDYARRRVILEPTAESEKPFPERQTYGLSVLASGPELRTYTIVAIRAGSGAERDGLKKADRIVGLDGRSSSDFLLSELREKLSHQGERHVLDVQREKEILHLGIEVNLVSLDR